MCVRNTICIEYNTYQYNTKYIEHFDYCYKVFPGQLLQDG